MKELIDVFKMEEIPAKTRVDLIVRLGTAINSEHGMNLTEPVVVALIKILDPENPILADEHYLRYL